MEAEETDAVADDALCCTVAVAAVVAVFFPPASYVCVCVCALPSSRCLSLLLMLTMVVARTTSIISGKNACERERREALSVLQRVKSTTMTKRKTGRCWRMEPPFSSRVDVHREKPSLIRVLHTHHTCTQKGVSICQARRKGEFDTHKKYCDRSIIFPCVRTDFQPATTRGHKLS